jgi:hypothetical protein
MRTTLAALVTGSGLLLAAAPLVAHHGFETEYDANRKISSSGVVARVEWTNPHMHIYIDVTEKEGQVTTYNMEMASPNTVQRQGWGRNTLLPGDKVVFEGYGGKAVFTRGALAKIAKAETPDKPLFVQGGPEAPGFPVR